MLSRKADNLLIQTSNLCANVTLHSILFKTEQGLIWPDSHTLVSVNSYLLLTDNAIFVFANTVEILQVKPGKVSTWATFRAEARCSEVTLRYINSYVSGLRWKLKHKSDLSSLGRGAISFGCTFLRWWAPSNSCSSWGKIPSIRSMVVFILLWSRISTNDLSFPMMSFTSSSLFWSSDSLVGFTVALLLDLSEDWGGVWKLELVWSPTGLKYVCLWGFVSVWEHGALSSSLWRVKAQKPESCPVAPRLFNLVTPRASGSTAGSSPGCKKGQLSFSVTASEWTILTGTLFAAEVWFSVTCVILKYGKQQKQVLSNMIL